MPKRAAENNSALRKVNCALTPPAPYSILCGTSDLMSDVLAGLSEGCILLTGLTTVQVIRTAMVAGVGAAVFVRGTTPPQEVTDLAREQELPLISSTYSMFVSCDRLHACKLTGIDGRR